MKRYLCSIALDIFPCGQHVIAQSPKFDLADIHTSPTPFWFAQNSGGRLRDGLYINRDATVLQLVQAAYGVTEDISPEVQSWLKSDLWLTWSPKCPKAPREKPPNLMLQTLLTGRFRTGDQ